VRSLLAWLIGQNSFELFGQLGLDRRLDAAPRRCWRS